MIESKAKELALLEYRQAVIKGWTMRPKQRNAELAAAAAIVKAEAAAAKAEAKAAKLAEKGETVDDENGAGGTALDTSAKKRAVRSSSSKGRRKKKVKESESEDEEELELTDDDEEE